jgi:thioredoxin 1
MGLDAAVEDVIELARRLPALKELGLHSAEGKPAFDTEAQVRIWKELPNLTVNRTWYSPSTVESGVRQEAVALEGDASVKPIDLTTDTWDDAIASDTTVLVDFWAEWCGPCKAIAPTIEKLAGELAGRVTVAKVDVDSNKEISERYGIRGIPALFVFRNGDLVAKIGSQDRDGILEQLGPVLAS